VVNSLWRGEWVQRNNENDDIDYVPYHRFESASFWDHLNPERIAVPRYQAAFRITVWILFLFGETTRTSPDPSGPLDPGAWDVLMGVRSVFAVCAEVRLCIAHDPPVS
jgi:hypothetical protein